jgi:hypothetical protein
LHGADSATRRLARSHATAQFLTHGIKAEGALGVGPGTASIFCHFLAPNTGVKRMQSALWAPDIVEAYECECQKFFAKGR